MSPTAALLAFTATAGMLTITPGLDTALVLRTALADGRRAAMAAALGVALGCLGWAALVAIGLGAMLIALPWAFAVLRWAGAGYLAVIGLTLLRHPRRQFALDGAPDTGQPGQALRRGLLTNLLNPKVGLFYLALLPQFIPTGAAVAPWSLGLGAIHAGLGLGWFALLLFVLPPLLGPWRQTGRSMGAIAWLDRVTGAVFLGFAVRLAVARA